MSNPRQVSSERDLAALIAGDEVKVDIGEGAKWMIYLGLPEGEETLSADTKITFYELREHKPLLAWSQAAQYLQFPGEHIHFDLHHRNLELFPAGGRTYEMVKQYKIGTQLPAGDAAYEAIRRH